MTLSNLVELNDADLDVVTGGTGPGKSAGAAIPGLTTAGQLTHVRAVLTANNVFVSPISAPIVVA